MMKNKAFTLIELLVVVLIIGILAAIALPQYETAVHKSRFAENMLLFKRMEQTVTMYLLENSFPDDAVDLEEIYDLTDNLDPNGRISWWMNCNYNVEDACGWEASYTYQGEIKAQLKGLIMRDGSKRRWCAYEDEEIGKKLCLPLSSLGFEVFSGLE